MLSYAYDLFIYDKINNFKKCEIYDRGLISTFYRLSSFFFTIWGLFVILINKTFKKYDSKFPWLAYGFLNFFHGFLIYINDVVEATLNLGINADIGTTWHISTKKALSIKDLVLKICEITNVNYNEIVKKSSDRLGKDQTYLLNSDAMRENFGWKDKIGLKEGLLDTISWVEKNLDVIKMLSWEYNHKE